MVVTTVRKDMVTVTRASLLSLRAAVLRSGDAQAAVTLQEAGYAGGSAQFESFKAWLADRTHIGVEELDVDSFQHLASEYFGEHGWGKLHVGSIEDVVATLDSPDWGECDLNLGANQPSCHLTTGMFADLFGRLAGAPVAVLEVECRSAGQDRCRFLVGSPDVMDAVYEEMGRGADYEGAIRSQAG
jgi:predicted hydrocarbon binding protein